MGDLLKDFFKRVAPIFIWLFINFVCRSSRIKKIKLNKLNENVIYAFWHGRIFLLSYAYRFLNIHLIASPSEDGSLLASTLKKFGYKFARGSSSKKGISATVKLAKNVTKGFSAGIAVDGPRGPYHEIKPGVVFIAKKTGKPIVPLTSSAKRKKILNSWDKFLLPLPFNKCVVIEGPPIYVGDDDEVSSKINELKSRLDEITDMANKLCLK